MVEKIIIDPQKIRGLENIVSEKDVDDFETDDLYLHPAIDTVNGSETDVYIMTEAAMLPNRLDVSFVKHTNYPPNESEQTVLSKYHSETGTFTATVRKDYQVIPNCPVIFYENGSIVSGAYTDNQGKASIEYVSIGSGDVKLEAKCINLISSVNIEDCIYFNYLIDSIRGSSSTYDLITPNGIGDLPERFEWSCKMWHTSPQATSQARLFISSTTATTAQPDNGLFLQFGAAGLLGGGSRRSGTTIGTDTLSGATSYTKYAFKMIRNEDDFTFYCEDNNLGTLTESWFKNYTNFYITTALYKEGQMEAINVKIKKI